MYKEVFIEDRKKLVKATFYEGGEFSIFVEKKRGDKIIEIKEADHRFKVIGDGRVAVYFCGILTSEENLYSGDTVTLKGLDIESYLIDPSAISQRRRDRKDQKEAKKRKRLGILD